MTGRRPRRHGLAGQAPSQLEDPLRERGLRMADRDGHSDVDRHIRQFGVFRDLVLDFLAKNFFNFHKEYFNCYLV